MSNLLTVFVVLLALWPITGAHALPAPQEAPGSARAAIVRALPLLQQSGEEWFESRSCRSCHHAGLNLLAIGLARERGLAVDEGLAASLVGRYRRSSNADTADILQGDAGINAQIGQAYRLVALAAAGVEPNPTTDACVHFLAGKQQPDGHWRSESHRPPLEDSEFTATALAARAIQLYAPPGRAADMASRARRAHGWLATAEPRCTEERVMRLFGLAWTGGLPDELSAAAAGLVREQRDDGGWAQIPTRASDAYATGQALVALHHVGGLAVTDPAWRLGAEFLLRTQLGDGTWRVETRRKAEGLKHFETGFPHGIHQFISYAATCWAVSALASTVSPAPSPIWTRTASLPRPGPDATPDSDGLPPLVRAALYEDVAALQRLLEAGADVNQRGERGLTALTCAAGDAAKVSLLLDYGADASAHTELGLSPLLAAAAYDGGLATLRLLLGRNGAAESPPEELGAALRLATLAGDTEKVDLLLAAGAEIEAGKEAEGTPLALATFQGDAGMIRHLLAQGADPDPVTGGATPLIAAVIDGQREAALALLQAGARVDARDSATDGFTPLMWAATVDFGETAVLEALLAGGADVNARDGSGATALSCARANANVRAAALLLAAGARD